MARKINPIALRTLIVFDTSPLRQQLYNHYYSPYIVNDIERLSVFIRRFTMATNITLHSFKVLKTSYNDAHVMLRFVMLDSTATKNESTLRFFRLEDAFVYGLSRLLKSTRVAVSFLDASKVRDQSLFLVPKVFLRWQFFTRAEIHKSLGLLLSQRGCAFFLASFISFKLGVLRTKSNKKKQVYFLALIRMMLQFVKNYKRTILKGVKVLVKGRLNGAPIAKKWLFFDGVLSLQQIDNKIDFHYAPAFTVFGVLGVKVWVHY